jgi:ribosome-associated translation inhibitor RaiA
MNIEYVGRNYEVDERLRGFTEDKLGKLDKFLHEPVEIRVTF